MTKKENLPDVGEQLEPPVEQASNESMEANVAEVEEPQKAEEESKLEGTLMKPKKKPEFCSRICKKMR